MFGAWSFIHGHSGQVEDLQTAGALQRKGWGLSFWQRAGTSNWVHFAVPSHALYNWRVDYLRVKFNTGEHARVSEIHLWDGNVQFWQHTENYFGGETDVEIELGKEWEINRGLGVSIKVEAAAGGDALFMFHAVGANFRQ